MPKQLTKEEYELFQRAGWRRNEIALATLLAMPWEIEDLVRDLTAKEKQKRKETIRVVSGQL